MGTPMCTHVRTGCFSRRSTAKRTRKRNSGVRKRKRGGVLMGKASGKKFHVTIRKGWGSYPSWCCRFWVRRGPLRLLHKTRPRLLHVQQLYLFLPPAVSALTRLPLQAAPACPPTRALPRHSAHPASWPFSHGNPVLNHRNCNSKCKQRPLPETPSSHGQTSLPATTRVPQSSFASATRAQTSASADTKLLQ